MEIARSGLGEIGEYSGPNFIPLRVNVVPSSAVKTPSLRNAFSKEYMFDILSFGCTKVPFLFFEPCAAIATSFPVLVTAAEALLPDPPLTAVFPPD